MADVGQRHVEQQPHMRVRQAVIGHPACPADHNDPVGTQEPEVMGDGGFTGPRDRGKVAHAHLPFEQRDQYPEPAGIAEQAEDVRDSVDLLAGHGGSDRGYPVGVNHADGALIEAGDLLV